MMEKISVDGYEAFQNSIKNIDKNKLINCYFTAIWCPDCKQANDYILSAAENYAPEGSAFITCDVGDIDTWRSLTNPFRTDKDIKLTIIPTLLRWKHPQRLEGEQHCSRDDILKLFFTDEES